jgi:mono/diheme cytochrome c family protein
MQTYFYVIGGALVLIALAISFIGMRSESFPSNNVLRLGIVFVAAVVIATAYGAVKSSQDEQQKREDEQNQVASSEADQIAVSDTRASGVPDTGGSQAPGARQESDTSQAGSGSTATPIGSGDAQAGAQIFVDQGCGSCHSLQAANAKGTIGPNLDEALADKDTAFIETSIVDPSAFVEQGFQDGIMPQDFGDVLSPDDLANLVAYLSQSTASVKSRDAAASKSASAKK